MQVILTNTHRR
ncbi:hypothetical protein PG984_013086 [Apiospora sp. TS-2023a]